jgi:hypothetical protein
MEDGEFVEIEHVRETNRMGIWEEWVQEFGFAN